MSRCQHCKKLTHSEDLVVEYDIKDFDKIVELRNLSAWRCRYEYGNEEAPPEEIGTLKCGDIYIHFRSKKIENK